MVYRIISRTECFQGLYGRLFYANVRRTMPNCGIAGWSKKIPGTNFHPRSDVFIEDMSVLLLIKVIVCLSDHYTKGMQDAVPWPPEREAWAQVIHKDSIIWVPFWTLVPIHQGDP